MRPRMEVDDELGGDQTKRGGSCASGDGVGWGGVGGVGRGGDAGAMEDARAGALMCTEDGCMSVVVQLRRGARMTREQYGKQVGMRPRTCGAHSV